MDNFDIALNKLKFNFPYSKENWLKNMYVENYHRHTTWSNPRQKDCVTTLESMIEKIHEYDGKCMFSMEHGWQGRYLHVYDLANKANLKFIYSTEAYWVKNRHEKDRSNCHIILVAKTQKGIEDLNEALSFANIDGFYAKPRIDLELIMKLDPNDVIITSSCVAGWKYEDSEDIWLDIHKKFGDSFFLEVQYHYTDKQKILNERICKLSKKHSIQLIAGLDTHYLNNDDKKERENYLAQNGLHYDDEDGWYMDYPDGKEIFNRFTQQGILSEEEILLAMMNTCVFIDKCDTIEFDRSFKIPSVHKGKSSNEKKKLFLDLLNEKYASESYKSQEKRDGMMYEYNEIIGCDTEDYFMFNENVIRNGINKYGGVLTTTSRGSAASFVTSKLLGFTTIDRFTSEIPMYPQRFLTKERILKSGQMPDIDMNMSAQEPFVRATKDIVREEGCYPLVAWGQLKEKSAWKMYADLKGVPPQTANEVSKYIDKYNMDWKHAETDEEKEDIHIEDYIPEEYIEIYNESVKYQGIVDSSKCHACGFLVLDDDIRRKCGVIRCVSESNGNSVLCSVIDGGLLDSFGYVKQDYLIVSVVDIIDRCWKSIGQKVPTIDELRELTKNDLITWNTYKNGITMCVNQCERDKTTQRVMKYSPTKLEEVSAFVAAIRPGFKSLLGTFINREKYSTGEDKVDELLESSSHFLLYQESLMKIFSWLGIDMGECYEIIKAISKKKLKGKKLADFEQKLSDNWMKNVGDLNNFDKVYQIVKDSAFYAFNSPHALAVAADSLYIAYFKQHYTSKFYEVALNYYMEKNKKDKVNSLLKEAMHHFGYKMGSYQYGKDNSKFTVDDNEKIIYPNLASIKGIGSKVVLSLMDMHNEKCDSIIEVYIKIKGTAINKTHIRNLIRIGYFKQFGSPVKLLKICDILDTFFDKKQLDIEKLRASGYDIEEIARFGRKTAKKIMDIDIYELVMYLIDKVEDVQYNIFEKMINQHKVLGFIDEVDDTFDDNVCMVQEIEINPWGTPFLNLYRICDGAMDKIKVDKKFFNYKNPVEQYDVISIVQIVENMKKRKDKETNKYYETGEKEIVLQEYSIVRN